MTAYQMDCQATEVVHESFGLEHEECLFHSFQNDIFASTSCDQIHLELSSGCGGDRSTHQVLEVLEGVDPAFPDQENTDCYFSNMSCLEAQYVSYSHANVSPHVGRDEPSKQDIFEYPLFEEKTPSESCHLQQHISSHNYTASNAPSDVPVSMHPDIQGTYLLSNAKPGTVEVDRYSEEIMVSNVSMYADQTVTSQKERGSPNNLLQAKNTRQGECLGNLQFTVPVPLPETYIPRSKSVLDSACSHSEIEKASTSVDHLKAKKGLPFHVHGTPGPTLPACRPVLVKALYRSSCPESIETSNERVVLPACQKEWIEKLNLSKEVLQGQVQAVGHVRGASDMHATKRVIIVEPNLENVPIIRPIMRTSVQDLLQTHTAQAVRDRIPLGKPCFSPFEPGMFAVAEEVHPEKGSSCSLILASVQRSPALRMRPLASVNLVSPASCLAWLSPHELLVSAGRELIIMKANESALRMRTQLPEFHLDDIRDVQLNPFKTNLCLSGGYDGCIFMTDLERLASDQLSSVRCSENYKYATSDSVSSVLWNPLMGNLASATTDTGFLHVFDTRVKCAEKRTIIIETGVTQLNTHAWGDASNALLGYGDGSMRLFDMRKPDECVVLFRDPFVRQIGDLVFDPQRRFLVSFGNPRFSIWRSGPSGFTLLHHDPACVTREQLAADVWYKCSGAFMLTGGRQHGIFGLADTGGNLSLYDLHAAECPVIAISGSSSR